MTLAKDAIALEKKALRRRLRAARDALGAEARRERSSAIVERIGAWPVFQNAPVVLFYLPVGSEVDLTALRGDLRASHKTLVLPRVESRHHALSLRRYALGDPLERTSWGLLEPLATAPLASADSIALAFVPALGVDRAGHRIGYGKGYYDRLLPQLRRALTCAVVFELQRVEVLVRAAHDVAVHAVMTEQTIEVVSTGRCG